MQVYYSKAAFQDFVRENAKVPERTVGLVPTMGALHEGHLSLVRAAQAECDKVAATIFVNPMQFGPAEDFTRYPRTLEKDLEGLEACGTDAVLVPKPDDIYPKGFQTTVTNTALGDILCSTSRPGHFNGVLTVVSKLINIAQADRAYFGRKDYQQLTVVTRMASDLDMKCQIVGCPTVREESGLAMSSRNAYLADDERESANAIYVVLRAIKKAAEAGEHSVDALMERAQPLVDDALVDLEYLEFRSPDLETHYDNWVTCPAVALIAVRIGKTRLIDNIDIAA